MSVTVSRTSDVNDKLASSESINKVPFGQSNQPTAKIARKTMTLVTPKTENPPSIASSVDDYEMHYAMNSPQSSVYCEYNMDKSPTGLSNGPVVTPLSSIIMLFLLNMVFRLITNFLPGLNHLDVLVIICYLAQE